MSDTNLLLAITVAVFFVLYLSAVFFLGGSFTKPQNFLNILNNNASLIVLSCGMSVVMITGGIDISVGAVTSLVCMACAVNLENQGGNIFTMILIGLGIGLAFGLVQGFLVAYLEIQPFIVSMAGMFFARGMTAVISTNQLSITQETNATFYSWANWRLNLPFGGVPNRKGVLIMPYLRVGVLIALVVLVVIFLVLRYTKFGRSLYAVGGSEQSAAMMGLNVKQTKMKAYILSSFLCSIGGICYCLNTQAASVSQASRGSTTPRCGIITLWWPTCPVRVVAKGSPRCSEI